MKSAMGWKFHSGYKWWEGAAGYGKYAVQKMRDGKWALMKVPWFGNPDLLGSYSSKETAMRHAEELSHVK